ncbi:MAG: hypothetical protein ACYC2H_05635 [Thermoplasmatota archaeon]
MPWMPAAVATVALLLVAAKAHGRQIRIEREQQGYFRIDFRSKNAAAVEAIWRRDRLLFWPVFATLGVAGLVWAIAARDLGLGALVVGWAFAAAFTVAGLTSWVRMVRRDQGPLPWRQRALRGSAGWWLAVAAAAALVGFALTV